MHARVWGEYGLSKTKAFYKQKKRTKKKKKSQAKEQQIK